MDAFDADRNPWDRQTDESSIAFEAFQIFRDLGPSRSLTAAHKALGRRRYATLRDWRQRFRWDDRIMAWEMHLDRDRQREVEERRRKTDEDIAEIGRSMLEKVKQRMLLLDAEHIGDLTIWEAARLYRDAVHSIRLVEGQSTEVVDVIDEADVDREIRRLVAELAARGEAAATPPASESEILD